MVRFKWAFEKDAEGLRPPLRGRNVLEIQALTPKSVKNVKGGVSCGAGEYSSAEFSWIPMGPQVEGYRPRSSSVEGLCAWQ